MIDEFTCPNCGESPWVKTVAHYMCLKCGGLCLHDYAIEMGFIVFRAEEETMNNTDVVCPQCGNPDIYPTHSISDARVYVCDPCDIEISWEYFHNSEVKLEKVKSK